jgi:hypothetical protein
MKSYLLRFWPVLAVLIATWSGTAAVEESKVIHFHRVSEPHEGAFTMLVPDGWQTVGGVYRVNPTRAGGAGNSVAAKVDFLVKRDAAGTVMVHTLPDNLYMDMRRSPAAAMFPPGSNYNGMVVSPPMDALSYLANVAFRFTRPQARNVSVAVKLPLPGVARSYDRVCRNMGLPPDFRNDAALMLVAYEEGGVQYKEVLYTDVQVMLFGMWGNKDTYMARAPANEFDRMCRVFKVMHESVRLNPQWMAREIQSQAVRGQMINDVQHRLQEIDAEIVQHRQATNAEINSQIQLMLAGKTTTIDPHTGKAAVVPADQGQVFFGKNGDVLLADDPAFDPAKDPRYASGGYEKSKQDQ